MKIALSSAGVEISSVLPLYRWSGPDEDERQVAVGYWKRAIEITVELGCTVMNSEVNGRPEQSSLSEPAFWRSMEELLPVFEREGIQRRLEPHADDFVDDGRVAVDMVRGMCVGAPRGRVEPLQARADREGHQRQVTQPAANTA